MHKQESPSFSDEHIDQHLLNSRRAQLLWLTGVAAVSVGLLVALRLVMLGQENVRMMGLLGFIALTVLLISIKNGLPLRIASTMLIVISTIIIGALAHDTGGVSSPIAVILPFIPLLGFVLLSRKIGIACSGAVLLTIGLLTFFSVTAAIPANETVGALHPVAARGGFLAALVITSMVMAYHQSKISDAMAAKIRSHATYDYLTSLPNRRHLDATLERDLKVAQRDQTYIAALLIDIDDFKLFNDTQGHLQGDACLREVAAELAKCLRRPSDLVGRFGGEEFLVIMPGTDAEGALSVAETMRSAIEALQISHNTEADGEAKVVTISLGVCCIAARSANTSDDLVGGADKALYMAKHNGRNRVELLATLSGMGDQTMNFSDYMAIDRAAS